MSDTALTAFGGTILSSTCLWNSSLSMSGVQIGAFNFAVPAKDGFVVQRAVGGIRRRQSELLPQPGRLETLRTLIHEWWRTTLDLVAEAKK